MFDDMLAQLLEKNVQYVELDACQTEQVDTWKIILSALQLVSQLSTIPPQQNLSTVGQRIT